MLSVPGTIRLILQEQDVALVVYLLLELTDADFILVNQVEVGTGKVVQHGLLLLAQILVLNKFISLSIYFFLHTPLKTPQDRFHLIFIRRRKWGQVYFPFNFYD